MPFTVTVTKTWDDGKVLNAIGTLVASGSYTTGGDTLNLQQFKIKSSRTPYWVHILGQADFSYTYIPGTNLSNGKVLCRAVSTGAEASAAAYPAGVTGDTIRFFAMCQKLK